MMSFLAECSLAAALAVTCASVFILHRRLKRLGDDLAVYRQAIAESAAALNAGGKALGLLVSEGRTLAETLGARIDAAGELAPSATPQPLSAALHRFRNVAADRNSPAAA